MNQRQLDAVKRAEEVPSGIYWPGNESEPEPVTIYDEDRKVLAEGLLEALAWVSKLQSKIARQAVVVNGCADCELIKAKKDAVAMLKALMWIANPDNGEDPMDIAQEALRKLDKSV